eukprot:760868-Hanusia_phi.AAC.3
MEQEEKLGALGRRLGETRQGPCPASHTEMVRVELLVLCSPGHQKGGNEEDMRPVNPWNASFASKRQIGVLL